VNIDYFPAAAWPTCVKHTDTNSAGRSAATGCFSGKGLPAGRVISGAPPHDGALPSRTARARFFFCVEPRPGYVLKPQPRRNHSTNSRGLRLAWLLGINRQIRRLA